MNNKLTTCKLGQVLNRFMVWFETHSSCILTRGITLSSLSGTAIAFQEFFAELFLPRGEQWIKAYNAALLKILQFDLHYYSQEPQEGLDLDLLVPDYSQQVLEHSRLIWTPYLLQNLYLCNICICVIFVIVQYLYFYIIYICAIFVFVVTHVGTHSSTFHLWAEAEDMLCVQSSSKDRNIPKGWLAISICYKKKNNKIIWDECSTGYHTIILGL